MKSKTSQKRFEFSVIFNKKLEQAPLEIKIALAETFEVFLENPLNETLRNHVLRAKYAGIHSIDITDDWRALYREERERIIFIEIGTHSQLYEE